MYPTIASIMTPKPRKAAEPSTQSATNIQFTDIQTEQITISWDKATGDVLATETIQRRETGTSIWFNETTTTGSTSTRGNLESGTQYDFRIRSEKTDGTFIYSAVETVTTLALTEYNLVGSSPDENTIYLNWDDVNNADFYRVEQGFEDSGDIEWSEYDIGNPIDIQESELTLSGLGTIIPGTYYYRVRAYINGSFVNYSNVVSVTIAEEQAPETATGLHVDNLTDVSIVLDWTAGNYTETYEVQYREVGASTWNVAGTTANTSLQITELNYHTDYEFRVESKSSSYSGSPVYSSTITQTTKYPAPVFEHPLDEDVVAAWQPLTITAEDYPIVADGIYLVSNGNNLQEEYTGTQHPNYPIDIVGEDMSPKIYSWYLVAIVNGEESHKSETITIDCQ